MAEKEGVTRMDHFGIYHIRGCQMKPWYGLAVKLEEKTDVQVIIKRFWNRLGGGSAGVKEKEHFLAAVISENLWEYGKAETMLKTMKIEKGSTAFFYLASQAWKKGCRYDIWL